MEDFNRVIWLGIFIGIVLTIITAKVGGLSWIGITGSAVKEQCDSVTDYGCNLIKTPALATLEAGTQTGKDRGLLNLLPDSKYIAKVTNNEEIGADFTVKISCTSAAGTTYHEGSKYIAPHVAESIEIIPIVGNGNTWTCSDTSIIGSMINACKLEKKK